MSKCHVEQLMLVYKALVKDALCAFPQFERDFQRDLERLRRVANVRGVLTFTVDLPEVGKHFDRCLAEAKWSHSGLPFTGRSACGPQFPKFLRGLLGLVFEDSGHLKKESLDVEAIVFIRQFLYCAKKTELPCPEAAVLQEIEDFVALDNALPEPEEVWKATEVTASMMEGAYRGFSDPGAPFIGRLLEQGVQPRVARLLCENLDIVSGLVATTLGVYDPMEWRFRHGPGAIAERTGPVNKYHWSNWSARLEGRFPIADYGFHNFSSWASSGQKREIGSLEPASRLVAVPKTMLKPRLIAAEPSENQWCQQNLMSFFDERCKSSWLGKFVDFHDQTLNQRLCRLGSQDGSLLTCDLSSASDRVTCAVVGQVFRRNLGLLCALQAVRTRFLEQGLNPRLPQRIELRKFSTMGSACTFPVESLVFLSVVLAVSITNRDRWASKREIESLIGKVAVYGDDLVAPCDDWALLQKALSALHFKVNASKSYATGRFRESCGVDSFNGVDVTPVYWKGICNGKPESIRSTLAVRNNFYTKWFHYTAEEVGSTIPCYFVTVAMDSGVDGKKSFVGPDPASLTTRWNGELQRTEVMSSVLSSRSDKLKPVDDSGLLQYFTEAPSPFTHWEAGVAQRPRLKIRRGWIPIESIGLASQCNQ